MAIVLEAIYAKKLGLPGYSSHQFSVSIRTELTDLAQVEQESLRLYRLLQDSVDQSIQETGFLPIPDSKMSVSSNGNGKGTALANGFSNGSHAPHNDTEAVAWRCSDKQRELIQKLVADKDIDKHEVESIAQAMFGVGVRHLDKLQASGLIDELFVRFGASQPKAAAKSGRKSNGHQRMNGFPPAPPLRNLPVPQHEGGWS